MTAARQARDWRDVLVAMGTQREAAVVSHSGHGEVGEGFTDVAFFFFFLSFSPERSVNICQTRGGKNKAF